MYVLYLHYALRCSMKQVNTVFLRLSQVTAAQCECKLVFLSPCCIFCQIISEKQTINRHLPAMRHLFKAQIKYCAHADRTKDSPFLYHDACGKVVSFFFFFFFFIFQRPSSHWSMRVRHR